MILGLAVRLFVEPAIFAVCLPLHYSRLRRLIEFHYRALAYLLIDFG